MSSEMSNAFDAWYAKQDVDDDLLPDEYELVYAAFEAGYNAAQQKN